jgi:hypothetical protein
MAIACASYPFAICCLMYFAFNLVLIELAPGFGILNSFSDISLFNFIVPQSYVHWFYLGKRSFSTNWTPVKVYSNADIHKDEIRDENRGKSVIYR